MENVPPGGISCEPHWPSVDVTVCGAFPRLIHRTTVPDWTFTVRGSNWLSSAAISTDRDWSNPCENCPPLGAPVVACAVAPRPNNLPLTPDWPGPYCPGIMGCPSPYWPD